jgi:hypothetical protein
VRSAIFLNDDKSLSENTGKLLSELLFSGLGSFPCSHVDPALWASRIALVM